MLSFLLNDIFTSLLKVQLLESLGVRQNYILTNTLVSIDVIYYLSKKRMSERKQIG